MPRRSCLLAVLVAACAGGGDDASDLFTIDTLPGGIPQVVSSAPIEPGQWSLVHERDVQPAEGEPGELLNPEDIALGEDGILYVVENSPAAINMYGPDGVFLKQLARNGAGPGEIESAFIALHGDTLAIQDPSLSRGTTINVRDGSLISTRPTTGFYWHPIGIDGQGRAVARMSMPPDSSSGPRQGFIRFAMTGESSDTAILPERPEPTGLQQWAVTEDGRMRFRRLVPLRGRPLHAIDPTGGFVTGWSGEYALAAVADGGDTTMVFRRQFTAEPVTAAEKQSIVDQVITDFDFNTMGVTEAVLRRSFDPSAIPDQRPAFEGIWVDRDGRRWLRLSSSDTTRASFDLFDRDGRWLDQLHIPASDWPRDAWRPISFTRDHVAVLIEDIDGLPLVRIYRVERR